MRFFSSKMGFCGNNKELQSRTCIVMVNQAQVQRNKGEEHPFIGRGRSCCKQWKLKI